ADARPERQAILGRSVERGDGPTRLRRIRSQEQRTIHWAGRILAEALSQSEKDPSGARQLQDPQQPCGASRTAAVGRSRAIPLPAALLSGPQPHRAAVEGPARQCDAQSYLSL